MPISRFLEQFRPEREYDGKLVADRTGDAYLPLSDEIRQPLPVDSDHPGKGLMMHVLAEGYEGNHRIERQLEAMCSEGIVGPRRYAFFARSPILVYSRCPRIAHVVVNTPFRWSRESLPDGEISLTQDVEGLVGVALSDAATRAPNGISYWDKHPVERIRRLRERTGVVSYIPPEHIEAIAFLSGDEHETVQVAASQHVLDFILGKITETDAGDRIVNERRHLPVVDRAGRALDGQEREALWSSVAAMYTGHALMLTWDMHFLWGDSSRKWSPGSIQPSYHWTRQFHEQALSADEGQVPETSMNS